MTPTSLDGLRVVDATEGVAGGYCTRLIAGLGADVIKVERPRVGDRLRREGPFVGNIARAETSALQLHLAAGKRSITLDITSPTGAALLHQLIARADVFVCAPESLDSAALQSRYPSLIIASISPFGADGPRAAWRATEIVLMAMSGYLWMNGDPDREPIKPFGHQAEYQTGLHAALGVLTACRSPEPGQIVDSAVVEAAGFLLAGAVQRETLMQRPQRRNGPRPATFAPNRLYPSTIRPCADGYVHVHCHNRFHDLISVLMQEPRLATPDLMAEPLGHADQIDALMDAWLATRTRAQAVDEAQDLRIPMTEVLGPAEVIADGAGHHAAREFMVDIEHPIAGVVRQPGAPLRMRATPWRVARAPLLAEHNVAVYCDELGLTSLELARLRAAGVV